MVNNGSCTNHRAIANVNPLENQYVTTDPNVIADSNWGGYKWLLAFPHLLAKIMVMVIKPDTLAKG